MIDFKDVSYSYRGSRRVLSGLTVAFPEGMVHGLLGRNGSGKSTMLKLMCGLLYPGKGEGMVTVEGENPACRKPSQLQQIMIVPEEFDLPAVSLQGFAGRTAPFYPGFDQEAFERNCRELAVDRRSRLDNMSMGERKKSYIAFALACNTPYLFMDEPTNGLDIPSKSVFRRLLSAHASPQRTIIISTHQVADLQRLIDNVVIIDEKGLVLNATTADIEKKLCFGFVEGDSKAIYSQEGLLGSTGVWENRGGEETTTDLELLFNAVFHNREQVTGIMNR